MKRRRRSRLEKKAVLGLVLFAILLCLISSIAVDWMYQRSEMQRYKEEAEIYTRAAVSLIDADRIEHYLLTHEIDESYRQVQYSMDLISSSSRLDHYYVFVPGEDGIYYIWSANNTLGDDMLGRFESYDKKTMTEIVAEYSEDPDRGFYVTKDPRYGYVATMYEPICNSQDHPVALVGVDFSMPDIIKNQRRFIIGIAISIAIVLAILHFLLFRIMKARLVDPIVSLDDHAKHMLENLESQNEMHIDIHTKDEIEELGHSFEKMYYEVREYIDQLAIVTSERKKIQVELDIASKIQASCLPSVASDFANREHFDIYATMNPAKEVGGDFYDFFMVDERHLAFVVADVSGKGVPAALFMMIGKILIKDHTKPDKDLGQVFTEVNRLLCEGNSQEMFITAFEGVLDLVTGELLFVNAGHELPFIYKAGGEFEAKKIKAGFVLAGLEGIRYRAGSLQLEPGDKIFQYSDGVTEATDINQELFGMERLAQSLNRVKEQRVEDILHCVKKDVDDFVGDAPQFDDITMLGLEFRKRMTETDGLN